MTTSSLLVAYSLATISTAAACVLRLAMGSILDEEIPYETFYVAVLASARYGGLGPGILAIILGGVAAAFFFVPPVGWGIEGFDNKLAFGMYLLVAGAIVRLTEAQRRARMWAEHSFRLTEENRARLEIEIEQRQEAQRAETLQREWLEVTLASIGDGVIATDAYGRVTFLNPTAATLTAWSGDSAISQPIESVFNIQDELTDAPVGNPAAIAIRERRVIGLGNTTMLIRRDGSRIPIADSGAPIIGRHGDVVGAVLVFRDVSEKHSREVALYERDRMIALSHDAIISTDAERRILTFNKGACELYGWDEADVRGKNIDDLLQRRDFTQAFGVNEAIRREGHWYGEVAHVCKDGRSIVVESRQVPLTNSRGVVVGILEIDRDLTQRKQAEEGLKNAFAEADAERRMLQAVLDNIPEGVAIADAPDVGIRIMSRWGEDLIGRPWRVLRSIPPDQQPAAWAFYHTDGKTLARAEEFPLSRAVLRGESAYDEEWMIMRPDGEFVPILCSAAPIRDREGKITGGLIAWRDLSQRKLLEEKLRETAKLESLGVLAGGIAHDFNNLLTSIMGHASVLVTTVPEASSEWVSAHAILRASEVAARLTQQMLAYSGKSQFIIEAVDLSQFVRQASTLVQSSVAKNIDVQLDLADNLPLVEADVAQLQQLVMNLLINGAEAIGSDGGRLRVATRSAHLDESYLRSLMASDRAVAGQYVLLEVEDTGCGMDEAVLSRIFDPFFTTKFTGRGLGLSAVLGIVRGHKGAINIDSAPGVGTIFRVFLPASAVSREQSQAAAIPQAAPTDGTILVIDDEEMLRSMLKASLEGIGYRVILASNGQEAVQTFQRIAQEVLVVILDVSMPGISCEEILRQLHQIRLDVRVLLSSGFSESEAMSRFRDLGLVGFLQKPYTIQVLAAKLRAATTGPSLTKREGGRD